MKTLIFIISMATSALFANYNPTMRIHFGASNALIRLQTGYFKCLSEPQKQQGIESGSTHSESLLNNMRSNFEALLMINNRGDFRESVFHNPPRFINIKSQFDGFQNTVINSFSFAQGFPCMTTFPGFGQIKGYWSVGVSNRLHTNSNELMTAGQDIGGRLGLNIYNPNSALQAEIYGFSNNVVVNLLVHRKLSEHFLVNAGVDYNQPVIGISAMAGSWRFTSNVRICKKTIQYGFQMTVNL